MDRAAQVNYLREVAERLIWGVYAQDIVRPEEDAADLVADWLKSGNIPDWVEPADVRLLREMVARELDNILLES